MTQKRKEKQKKNMKIQQKKDLKKEKNTFKVDSLAKAVKKKKMKRILKREKNLLKRQKQILNDYIQEKTVHLFPRGRWLQKCYHHYTRRRVETALPPQQVGENCFTTLTGL